MSKETTRYTFGVENVHIHGITVTDGAVTYADHMALTGCTELTLDTKSESTTIYADNLPYATIWGSGSGEGSIKVYDIPEAFKTKYQGFEIANDGAIVKVDKVDRAAFGISFDMKTDQGNKRVLVYSVVAGDTKEEAKTQEDKASPEPYEIPLTIQKIKTGDKAVSFAEYKPQDTGYSTVHTNPTLPVFAESE